MSFLGDLIDSIGSDKLYMPPQAPKMPTSANSSRPMTDTARPGFRPGMPPNGSPLAGAKRKAEDELGQAAAKTIRPNPVPGLTSSLIRRPTASPLSAPRPLSEKTPIAQKLQVDKTNVANPVKSTPITISTSDSAPAKPPVKGSYADIMARAKLAAEQREQSNVGVIKHQTTSKEKTSKLADRRRGKHETLKSGKSFRTDLSGKQDKRRSVSPLKKDKPSILKAPRRSSNAPQSSYKGTMGKASGRGRSTTHGRNGDRKNRNDEYLGTDEEDNSDIMAEDEDEDDYGSDASSDMEAGAFDIDMEEQTALRQAKDDDAREIALENQLKREKEERRKRLEGLANKRK